MTAIFVLKSLSLSIITFLFREIPRSSISLNFSTQIFLKRISLDISPVRRKGINPRQMIALGFCIFMVSSKKIIQSIRNLSSDKTGDFPVLLLLFVLSAGSTLLKKQLFSSIPADFSKSPRFFQVLVYSSSSFINYVYEVWR